MILGALICLGALVIYLGITRRGEGPVYKGRSLQYWLEVHASGEYPDQAKAAEIAVRAIGTNALPYLLNWVAYEPPVQQDRLAYLIDRLNQLAGGRRAFYSASPDPGLRPFHLAHSGFKILREDAAPAVPALASLLNDTNGFFHFRAAEALAFIGRSALPPLLQAASNTNHQAHLSAVLAILKMHVFYSEHSQETVSALVRCIQDPDPFVATSVIRALPTLGFQSDKVVTALTNAFTSPHDEVRYEAVRAFMYSFSHEAAKAAPALRAVLNDSNFDIRQNASSILSQIDGEAHTNAPPQ